MIHQIKLIVLKKYKVKRKILIIMMIHHLKIANKIVNKIKLKLRKYLDFFKKKIFIKNLFNIKMAQKNRYP